MSIHGSSPSSLGSFEVCSALKELENGTGIIRINSEDILDKIPNPTEWFLSWCRNIGTPVSQSAEGELALSVRNESYGKKDARTRGPNTNRKLSFHTDRCDVIAFLCLMPAMIGGENQVVDSREIAKIIKSERPDLHKILQQQFPFKRHVVDQGNKLPYVMQPIFSETQGYFACSYLRVLIDRADQDEKCPSLSERQRDAINFLDQVCERKELQLRFTMERGDILLLNNWTLLHRRTEFEDFPEPAKKRHLIRIWLSMPNSRPIDQSFEDNFGSTKAGTVRGGMKIFS